MRLDRVMIAAPKSGSGKTTLTCALLQCLKNRGRQAASFKCGPDYIDPMFHQKVIGVSAKNLDTFFTDDTLTQTLFLQDAAECEIAVLEGVMGLYDGLGGVREEGSSYHLAKVTKTPIILTVDAKGAGRSLIALLAGFLAYDRQRLIKGVIFNRMSESYYQLLKPLAEQELNLAVLGYMPDKKDLCVESRHLGLKLPQELQNLNNQIQSAAELLENTVRIDKIIEIARNAKPLTVERDDCNGSQQCRRYLSCGAQSKTAKKTDDQNKASAPSVVTVHKRPAIAVARDEAFCFYYHDNLRLLEMCGAELIYFSPLHHAALPKDCSGLLLGGGYPELAAKQLSENKSMLGSVLAAIQGGMPTIAECGGFMYLHKEIINRDGECYELVGAVDAVCHDTGKLARFGYIELQEKISRFLPENEWIRGHEFHYYDSSLNGFDCTAQKPTTGKRYDCVIESDSYCLGFPHLYYPSNPAFARRFVEKAKKFAREK